MAVAQKTVNRVIVIMSTTLNQALAETPEFSDALWSANLRHELANIMTVISGCCDLLERPSGMDRKQLVDHIHSAVKRGHALLMSDLKRSDRKQHFSQVLRSYSDVV